MSSIHSIEKVLFKKNLSKKTLVVFNCPRCSTRLNEFVALISKADTCPECSQGFQFAESAWSRISYRQNFIDRDSLKELQTSKERARRIKHLLNDGVMCQWINNGTYMFSELQSVERVSVDGTYVFFPNSQSGVLLDQVVTEGELGSLGSESTIETHKAVDLKQQPNRDASAKAITSQTTRPDETVRVSIPCGIGENIYLLTRNVRFHDLPLLAMCCHKCKKTKCYPTNCPYCGNKGYLQVGEKFCCKTCKKARFNYSTRCPSCAALNYSHSVRLVTPQNYNEEERQRQQAIKQEKRQRQQAIKQEERQRQQERQLKYEKFIKQKTRIGLGWEIIAAVLILGFFLFLPFWGTQLLMNTLASNGITLSDVIGFIICFGPIILFVVVPLVLGVPLLIFSDEE